MSVLRKLCHSHRKPGFGGSVAWVFHTSGTGLLFISCHLVSQQFGCPRVGLLYRNAPPYGPCLCIPDNPPDMVEPAGLFGLLIFWLSSVWMLTIQSSPEEHLAALPPYFGCSALLSHAVLRIEVQIPTPTTPATIHSPIPSYGQGQAFLQQLWLVT